MVQNVGGSLGLLQSSAEICWLYSPTAFILLFVNESSNVSWMMIESSCHGVKCTLVASSVAVVMRLKAIKLTKLRRKI